MLTARQAELFAFIKSEIERCGLAPTYEEMMRAMGLRSKSPVACLVKGLEERSFIWQIPNRARAISIRKADSLTAMQHIAEAQKQIRQMPDSNGRTAALDYLGCAKVAILELSK